MNTRETATMTADEYRAAASAHNQEAADSFERCDTDGFLSQWASGINAIRMNALATLAENGGRAYFEVYVDDAGEPVPARRISTKYGTRVAVFATWSDCVSRSGKIVEWLSPKKADARWESGYFEAEAAIEMRGGYAQQARLLPARGYDLGLGAYYDVEPECVVADPRAATE